MSDGLGKRGWCRAIIEVLHDARSGLTREQLAELVYRRALPCLSDRQRIRRQQDGTPLWRAEFEMALTALVHAKALTIEHERVEFWRRRKHMGSSKKEPPPHELKEFALKVRNERARSICVRRLPPPGSKDDSSCD